jgi:hypothetical protein
MKNGGLTANRKEENSLLSSETEGLKAEIFDLFFFSN